MNSDPYRRRTERMSRVPSATRVVAYLPSLKTILQRLRATSATPSSLNSTLLTSAESVWSVEPQRHKEHSSPGHPTTIFSDLLSSSISPITTARHFPLPGAVGLAQDTPTHPAVDSTASTGVETAHNDPPAVLCSVKDKQHGTVECMAQEIPQFLVADLLLLFPGVSALPDGLNIITLSQHTVNDMTAWSVEVEKERDQLLEHFIDSAKEVCSRLNGAGFWSDFVDPSSGRAYYSAYSNATLFETDERFRYFGFDIIDLGCCKCVHHPVWKAFTFVGTIFTNAPTTSPAIQSIMEL